MMNHITSAEWSEYFTPGRMTEDRLALVARVHAHVGSCEQCRELYTRALAAREALKRYTAAAAVASTATAFRAVAGDAPAAENGCFGELSIIVDIAASAFLMDTLEQSGDCEKYAFELSPDAACLVDECDENTSMRFADGKLVLSFPCIPGVQPSATLSDGESEPIAIAFDEHGHAELPLPAPSDYTLKLSLNPVAAATAEP